MSQNPGKKSLPKNAATGLRDVPANAAWLFQKASKSLSPDVATHRLSDLGSRVSEATHTAAEVAGNNLRDTTRKVGSAGRDLAESVATATRHDDISDLMAEADSASAHARALEAEAVQLAQLAKDDADSAAAFSAEMQNALKTARAEAEAMVRSRVDHAQEQADKRVTELARAHQEELAKVESDEKQRVERVRVAEESAARSALEKIERDAESRMREAQEQAEQRHEQASRAIAEANDALTKAQKLATAAAEAAQEAATRASREAEQLAAEAKERAKVASRRAADAERSRQKVSQSLAQRPETGSSNGSDTEIVLTDDALETLPKTDLIRVAQEFDVMSPSAMNKSELVHALAQEGVTPDRLTKRELINLAEVHGLDVRPSMSKAELVNVVGSHINS